MVLSGRLDRRGSVLHTIDAGIGGFWGLCDPALVDINFPTVIAYTMLHVLLFALIGMIAAALAATLVWEIDQRHICGSQAVDHAVVQKFPSTLFLIVVLFAIFEVGFYIVMATRAAPLLGRLAWSNVAVGNLVAALGMGYYLWKMHPEIREKLIEHPLGETVDGE